MGNSLSKNARTFRGDPRPNISDTKNGNTDWLQVQARRYTAKEGGEVSGLGPKGFENLRQGRNKISFDNLTEWCRNDPQFAAAYAAHIGLILPGEAEFAGALTNAVHAYVRAQTSKGE